MFCRGAGGQCQAREARRMPRGLADEAGSRSPTLRAAWEHRPSRPGSQCACPGQEGRTAQGFPETPPGAHPSSPTGPVSPPRTHSSLANPPPPTHKPPDHSLPGAGAETQAQQGASSSFLPLSLTCNEATSISPHPPRVTEPMVRSSGSRPGPNLCTQPAPPSTQ